MKNRNEKGIASALSTQKKKIKQRKKPEYLREKMFRNNNRHFVEQFTAKVLDAVVMLMPSETAFIAFSMFSRVHCFLTDDLLS